MKGDGGSEAPLGDWLSRCGRGDPVAIEEFGRRFSRTVGAAFGEARALHGDLGVDETAFFGRVRTTAARLRSRGEDGPPEAIIASIAFSDLYLATACGSGSETAWRRLLSLHGEALRRSLGRPTRTQEESAESLLSELILPSGPIAKPLIASYDGSGSLRSWLRIVLASRRARQHRGLAGATRPEDPERLDERPRNAEASPDELAATRETASILRPAIAVAFRALEPLERLLLRLVFQDRKRQRDVARSLNMTESTVSRRLQRAYDRFRTTLLGQIQPAVSGSGGDWLETIAQLERGQGVGLAEGMDSP